MGRFFKFLIYLVLSLVVLVVAAIVVIPLVVDPNDFKGEIAAQVKQATGRDLQLGGDIGLSVFPWLGLELNQLRLSNAPGFGDQPFAVVEHARIRARLMPLLDQHLEVDKIQVDGLQLHLTRAEDGSTNWGDLAGIRPPAAAEQAPPGLGRASPETGPSEGAQALAGLAIGGLQLKDSRVVWEDLGAGQRYEVSDLDLDTGAVVPGEPLDVQLGFLLDSVQPPLRSQVRLSGTVESDEALKRIRVSSLELLAEQLQVQGLDGQASLTGSLEADLPAQRYTTDRINLSLRLKGRGLPAAGAAAELVARIATDLQQESLEVSDLRVDSGRLQLSGELRGTGIQSAPRFVGDLAVAEFSPRQLLQDLGIAPPETADPSVLERASATFHLQSTPDAVHLERLALVLDDTRLDGQVKLLDPGRPAVRFEMQADSIDLDRYLPPAGKDQEGQGAEAPGDAPPIPATGAPAPSASPAPLFPVETLRGLDLEGVLRVGSLVLQNLQARQIELNVKSSNGRLQLDDQVTQFYDGRLNGTVKLDVTGAAPRLSIEQHVARLQAGPLLRDLTGKERLTGTGGFNTSLTAAGQTPDALKRSLNGKLDFRFEDGAVKGFNLAQMIREAKARFKGEPLPPSDEPPETDFSELTGSALVTNGVIDNQDLLAKSPYLRVNGKGQANLVSESLDYGLTVVVVSTEKGQGGEGLEELEGIPVPVYFSGPFSDVDYRVDWKTVALATQKGKLEGKVDKEIDRALGDKVDDDVKEQVKGFIKGFLR
jgi:AsmA protein